MAKITLRDGKIVKSKRTGLASSLIIKIYGVREISTIEPKHSTPIYCNHGESEWGEFELPEKSTVIIFWQNREHVNVLSFEKNNEFSLMRDTTWLKKKFQPRRR